MKRFAAGFSIGILLSFIIYLIFSPVSSAEIISTPENGEDIISLINSAGESICIEMYVLSSDAVVESLISASKNGVDVKVMLERNLNSNSNKESFNKLEMAGVDVCWAPLEYKLLHSKLIIIDGKKVLIGSHNLSNSALEKNREISVVLEGNIVRDFLSLFLSDWNLGMC